MEEVFPSKSLPPAEELQPAPAVPGAVGAEEDLGGGLENGGNVIEYQPIYMANPPLFFQN